MTDFEKQKQDAVERVRKMNEVYRKKAAQQGTKREDVAESPIDVMKLIRFDAVKNDPDRLLLLGVLLLLAGEKTDPKLLYALLYIMI
ncbi:MAG: hypothetical protein IJ946_00520 [Clostridia bacterium]|nr:hypothetical protein [Clostridia bacterium]